MIAWEYYVADSLHEVHLAGRLSGLGADGWELVGFDARGLAFFKRPITPPVPAVPEPKPATKK